MEIVFDEEDLEPLFPEPSDTRLSTEMPQAFEERRRVGSESAAPSAKLCRSMQEEGGLSQHWTASEPYNQECGQSSADSSKKKRRREEPTLLMRAIGCLSRREYSEKELRSRLSRHSQDEGEVEVVLDRLKSLGYLSNSRFAENYVRVNSRKKGAAAIRYELSRHNLPPEVLQEVLEPLKETEAARAYAVWARKFELSKDRRERERQYRFLAYRGFSSEAIRKVVCGEYSPDSEE